MGRKRSVCFHNSPPSKSKAWGVRATSRSLADPGDSGTAAPSCTWNPRFLRLLGKNRAASLSTQEKLHLSSSVRSGAAFTPLLECKKMEKRGSPATGLAESTLKLVSEKGPHTLLLGHQGQVSRGCHGVEAAILVGENSPRWSRYHTGRATAVEKPDVRGNERRGISKREDGKGSDLL